MIWDICYIFAVVLFGGFFMLAVGVWLGGALGLLWRWITGNASKF
jgi:hypothetical protein